MIHICTSLEQLLMELAIGRQWAVKIFEKNPIDCHQLETVALLRLFRMLLCRSDIFALHEVFK